MKMSALVSKIDVVAWLNESAVIDDPIRKEALRLVRKTPATTLNMLGDDAVRFVEEALKTTEHGAALVGQQFVDTVMENRRVQAEKDKALTEAIETASLSESDRPVVEADAPVKKTRRGRRSQTAVVADEYSEEAVAGLV